MCKHIQRQKIYLLMRSSTDQFYLFLLKGRMLYEKRLLPDVVDYIALAQYEKQMK